MPAPLLAAAASAWETLPVWDAASAAPAGQQATAEEVPVAFSIGGVAYAVMMATPAELEDFAIGFCITEGIAAGPDEIRRIVVGRQALGAEVDITLAPRPFAAFLARHRRRNLRGHTSCGLCGIEDLHDLPRPPVRPRPAMRAGPDAVERAARQLRDWQPLSQATRAAHAAAWAGPDGEILLAREDVGRHCALDKLIGACAVRGLGGADGFCLVTSRCSHEMVLKAAAAGFAMLVAVSAPTTLAVRTAAGHGVALVARGGGGFRLYAGSATPG